MSAAEQKRRAAEAALEQVIAGEILGVGSGSTVNAFIDLLAEQRAGDVPAAVSASVASTERLAGHGIRVLDLNEVDGYPVYVDGADEFEPGLCLIKGGGAALTSEKIVASVGTTFVCIVDASKRVEHLGAFPLPVEVLPMALRYVRRRLRDLGGDPQVRDATATDHGNPILDVHGLRITDPLALETEIETIPGVVTCGIFARRPADIVLMATDEGVQRFG